MSGRGQGGMQCEGQPLGTQPAGSNNLPPCSAEVWLSRADLDLWETESLDFSIDRAASTHPKSKGHLI